jgi:hypothetical protein
LAIPRSIIPDTNGKSWTSRNVDLLTTPLEKGRLMVQRKRHHRSTNRRKKRKLIQAVQKEQKKKKEERKIQHEENGMAISLPKTSITEGRK